MTREQGEALERYLTEEPETCQEDGHNWRRLGESPDGDTYFKCRRCGAEHTS